MSRLTYLNESRETTELTQFEGDSWEELIKNADTVDQIFMHNAIDKLYEYEELEEKGLLLKLPCKVGTTVWAIEKEDIGLGWNPEYVYCIKQEKFNATMVGFFGKDIFLTKEEAEQELERLESAE